MAYQTLKNDTPKMKHMFQYLLYLHCGRPFTHIHHAYNLETLIHKLIHIHTYTSIYLFKNLLKGTDLQMT